MAHPLQDLVHKSVYLAGLEGGDLPFRPQDDDHGGDRHGAWEWTYVARTRQPERYAYVTIGVLETREYLFALEVWAGAGDRRGFGRNLVGRIEDVSPNRYTERQQEFVRFLSFAAYQAHHFPESEMWPVYARPAQ